MWFMLLELQGSLYVPDMGVNLLSVSRMVRNGHTVSFAENHCVVSDGSGKVLARAKSGNGNLYSNKGRTNRIARTGE